MRGSTSFATFTSRIATKLSGLVVAFTIFSLVAAGCGGGSPTGSGGGNTTTTVTAVVVSPSTATVNAGASQQLTATVSGTNNPSQAVTWSVSPSTDGTIDTTGKFTASSSITATTSAKVSAASTVPGYTNVTGSATITINPVSTPPPPTPTLTSVAPAVQWCLSQCGGALMTFTGANFAAGDQIVITPDANILSSQLVNSGEAQVVLGIDQVHETSGYFQAKVCKADGTGCSNAVSFALYSHNMCAASKAGEIFCLNPSEVVQGQNLFNGQPLNGYVDKYTAAGAPDGKFFVGAPTYGIAVDNDVTGFVIVDGGVYDENGGMTDTPEPQLNDTNPVTESAAENGYECLLQPAAANNLSCGSITGSPFVTTHLVSLNVGADPQSLTMGVTNGVTYAYVLTVGGSGPAINVVNVDTMTLVNSQPISGITSEAPGGSDVVVFDSLGLGVVVSYGDGIAAIFNESTLKTVGNNVTLPGTPVSLTADMADDVAVIGNADVPDSAGTFTVLNPSTGAATPIPGVMVPVLPTWLTVNAEGSVSYACSSAATCNPFTIPKAKY
ncbi:MAG TPA: Ig-like domain-containing protein [Candidatus Paceibacterota bacterium]|nr:Ig-like domain-containing protein [Candidatus Paceibacterota bacterium]